MPKISVITINYNNDKGLEKTLESTVSQTFPDFEIIVIDGGSTDRSVEVIKKYAGRIAAWVSEKDRGIYHAMNKGIGKATGEYCLFLNSGDVLADSGTLARVASLHHTEDILYGELIFDYGNKKVQPAKRPEKIDVAHLFHDNIWHPASFIRRSLFTTIGLYDEKYRIASDYDFFFHALIAAKVSRAYLPFPIAVFDTTGVSTLPENLQKVNAERKAIQQSYLSAAEILYLENLGKYKKKYIAEWLQDKPRINKLLDRMLAVYSRLRN